jgi:hypothetical protein
MIGGISVLTEVSSSKARTDGICEVEASRDILQIEGSNTESEDPIPTATIPEITIKILKKEADKPRTSRPVATVTPFSKKASMEEVETSRLNSKYKSVTKAALAKKMEILLEKISN